MKSLLEILSLASNYLDGKGVPRARREAEDLMSHVLGCERMALYMDFERPLLDDELNQFRELIRKRGEGIPYGYLVGKISFFGVDLFLTPAVLVPRPETELLAEKISLFLKGVPLEGKSLWDVCAGSGALGLSIKKNFPNLEVTLSDISARALEVAKRNAEANKLDVTLLEGDLLTPFSEKADFIVCNPPYLSEIEYAHVEREVTYEPKKALIGGATGLEFYIRLSELIGNYLKPEGRGWLEIGLGQGEMVQSIFESKGFHCRLESDYAGHDRFFFLERSS